MPELLDPQAVDNELAGLPGWSREGDLLHRTWELKGFNGAMQLANVVAYVANRLDHHPDIMVHDYKCLTVTTTTHSAGGITANDFALARAIEAALAAGG